MAYIKTGKPGGGIIESRDLKGGPSRVSLPVTGLDLHDLLWLPDGRIIYAFADLEAIGTTCNYWVVRVDARTGEPVEKPKRLTNWAGFCMDSMSATADGKRLAFQESAYQTSVYVADLDATGTRIAAPRGLTTSEWGNYPWGWTRDSKAVIFGSNRNGEWGLFKQYLDRDTPESVVTRLENAVQARVSPDGEWVFYYSVYSGRYALEPLPARFPPATTPVQLMRAPIAGESHRSC